MKEGSIAMTIHELVLLETSDIHGNVFPIQYGTNGHADLGIAKIATIIQEERKKHEALLLIDNGDLIQGTPLTYHYAKYEQHLRNPMIQVTNELNYDANILGNHEFNYGKDLLQRAIDESNYPWLSANIVDEKTKEPYYGNPYMVKEVADGIRVGILGLTTDYIPNWEKEEHISGMQFLNPVDVAKKWVSYLKEVEQVHIVVVAYHGGFERDLQTGEPTETLTGENRGYELCMELPEIDVLLTGHQHREIENEFVNGVLVVQPGSQGKALGKVILQIEKNGSDYAVVQKESSLLFVDGVEADDRILELITPYENSTQEWLDQPIGHIEGDMLVHDPMQIRLKDSPLIDFLNRVQMDVADVDVSCTALFDNLAPGFPKDVTMRSVVSNYIYPNTLVVIEATGKVIKEALELSATYFTKNDAGDIVVNDRFLYPKPQHFNYDMWDGIEYEIDVSKEEGKRITKLLYKDHPLQADDKLHVVMNNYRASGGGDYMMFKSCPVVKEIPIDVSEIIANYILRYKVIEVTVNHNWHVIG